MDIHFVVFIIHIFNLFNSVSAYQPPCLPGWKRSGQMCLLVKNGYQVTWNEARKDCKGLDATLLRFETGDDVMAFVQTVSKYAVDGWWTDLNEINHPGIWTWGNNEQVFDDALIWNQEPDDTRHVENCVSMSYEGKISDEMCWKKLGYICEYPLPGNGHCADNWINSETSCYYISNTEDIISRLSWIEALSKCMAMVPGQTPSLISLNSADENNLISEYLSASKVMDINWWIGLNDKTTEGKYVWSDGVAADTSYLNWEKAPNKLALVDKCGVVHGNGHMSYGKCNADLNYYACKLKLTSSELSSFRELGCSGDWIRAGHKCYSYHSHSKLTQSDARQHCQGTGGDLIKIETLDEMAWVSQQTINWKTNGFWTGLIRKSSGVNAWTWVDKSDVNLKLIKWNQEPNDYLGKEDCAVLTMDGVYNDFSCTNNAGYICQMQSVNTPCPPSWIMPSPTSVMCYYISDVTDNVTTTWYGAKDKCDQLGNGEDASLFAAVSKDDYNFVIKQLESRQEDPTGWWTDLTDMEQEGLWQYSNSYNGPPDRTLINWKGEPNNFRGHEDCTVMYYGGRYNDVTCTVKAGVVCEKSAVSSSQGLSTNLYLRVYKFIFVVSILSYLSL